jgi:hypothetical protein
MGTGWISGASGMARKQLGAKNTDISKKRNMEREIDNQSIMGEGGGLWKETGPPKFDFSIDAEFMMSSVYAD